MLKRKKRGWGFRRNKEEGNEQVCVAIMKISKTGRKSIKENCNRLKRMCLKTERSSAEEKHTHTSPELPEEVRSVQIIKGRFVCRSVLCLTVFSSKVLAIQKTHRIFILRRFPD